ncbi:hypothetical protein COL5a_005960 [Colletotrichum fioriniae]|uniref:uncharacterized protein n=1 Tax=Colletotrichum fioriniae TaxID=710243 RepID=UPI0032DB3B86|nr:hypothetical protein COL5a_005960 [Colletotrichum fioriniae]KAJ3938428.1 hypothetical protein N0V96_011679 [Colletotrichum fioriniae]
MNEIDDCTREWTFEPESFDYVHIRFLVGSIADWPALFKQAYRALKPGGYLESFEVSPAIMSDDGTVPETSALGQWGKFFEEGGRKMGRTFRVLDENLQRTSMQDAGFESITEWNNKVFESPLTDDRVCGMRWKTDLWNDRPPSATGQRMR